MLHCKLLIIVFFGVECLTQGPEHETDKKADKKDYRSSATIMDIDLQIPLNGDGGLNSKEASIYDASQRDGSIEDLYAFLHLFIP